jgi:hypothetical protein
LLSEVVPWFNPICSKFYFSLYFESLPDLLSHWPEIAILNGDSVLTDKQARANKKYMLSSHVLDCHVLSRGYKHLKSEGIMANLLHPVVLHLREQEVVLHQK